MMAAVLLQQPVAGGSLLRIGVSSSEHFSQGNVVLQQHLLLVNSKSASFPPKAGGLRLRQYLSLASTFNSTWPNDRDPSRLSKSEGDVTAETVSKLCNRGLLTEAVEVLGYLVQTQSRISTALFYRLLKRCVAQKNLVLGRRVHDLIVQTGSESITFLANHILRMYASEGKLEEAKNVFSRVTTPDVFTWSAIISAHSKHGEPTQAIQLYHEMRSSSVKPDSHVFVAALQACAIAADLESGRRVHADVLETGVQPGLFLCNSLVDMYAKCGSLQDARRVFDSSPSRDVVTWTAMLTGYAEHGHPQEALSLHEKMEQEGMIVANRVTFACLLRACARVGALQQGKQLHSQILERGLEADVLVGNCLVDMYAKCGGLEEARRVFDNLPTRNVVTWNAMIAGYSKCGSLEDARQVFDSMPERDVVTWNTMIAGYIDHQSIQEALSLYERMEQEVAADCVTFASLLKACAKVGALQQGRQLHLRIQERGLETNTMLGNCLVDMYTKCGRFEDACKVLGSLPELDVVTWNAMIAGYAKCGRLEDARSLFDSMPKRDVITWNAMIAGYAEHELGQEAISLYEKMEDEGLIPADRVTFSCLLRACGNAGALQEGKRIHSQILERGQGADTVVGNCLIDMYAKCGRLEDAQRVFDSLPARDVVTWNVLINGFGQSNEGLKAIATFHKMLRDGIQPDETTFTCLLVACTHEGLVNEGQQFFRYMVEDCGIGPTVQQYNCLVDLLGRSGYLDEAEEVLLSGTDDVGLRSLLSACRSYGDVERGARCFERLVRLYPQEGAAYVLMANIYADAGWWGDVDRIERLRRSVGASKKPAMAGIEVNRRVHTFVVGEEGNDISSKVRRMNVQLKEEGGHMPHTELVLKPVTQKEKEDELCGHAEKLAMAYGLLNTPDGTPLLVTKNLRMCWDCHSATEIMSRIEKREIIVRDSHRVHRFVSGSCGCGGRP